MDEPSKDKVSDFKQQAQDVFNSLDQDKNGKLSLQELLHILAPDDGSSQENNALIVKKLHLKSQAEVTFQEFWVMVREQLTTDAGLLKANLAGGSGEQKQDIAREMFREVDVDGSGEVSIKELARYFSSLGKASTP